MNLTKMAGPLAGAALALTATQVGAATNLVTNPGFENGTAGWTQIAASNGSDAGTLTSPTFAHSGNIAYSFAGSGPSDDKLQQAITTVAGTSYRVEGFYSTAGNTPSDLNVTFGDGSFSVTNPAATVSADKNYKEFSFVGKATTGSSNLVFGGFNAPADILIDDVSVKALSAPEPATWAMMLVGVGLMGARLRSNRAAKSDLALG